MSDCISDNCNPHFNIDTSFRLLDARHHDLSEPLNTASADPNGCAALHPSATHAIRLTFSSGIFERAPDNTFAPYGTFVTPERASATFHLALSEGLSPSECVMSFEVGPADEGGRCVLPYDSPAAGLTATGNKNARLELMETAGRTAAAELATEPAFERDAQHRAPASPIRTAHSTLVRSSPVPSHSEGML